AARRRGPALGAARGADARAGRGLSGRGAEPVAGERDAVAVEPVALVVGADVVGRVLLLSAEAKVRVDDGQLGVAAGVAAESHAPATLVLTHAGRAVVLDDRRGDRAAVDLGAAVVGRDTSAVRRAVVGDVRVADVKATVGMDG